MKRIFYCILGAMLISCTPKVIVNGNVFDGNTMTNAMNKKYSLQQFDSMCIADTLPTDLSSWQSLKVKDFETNDRVSLYSLYKKNVVYRVEITNDDSVKITKRVVE